MSRPIGKHHKLVLLPHLIKIIPNKLAEHATFHNGSKFYGFDLDSTLIETKSKMKFSKNPKDWKFVELSDPESSGKESVTTLDALLQLFKENSAKAQQANIVIFSNQGSVITVPGDSKSCTNLLSKLQNILEVIENSLREQDSLEFMNHIWVYCSPKMPSSLKKKKVFKIGGANSLISAKFKTVSNSANKITKKQQHTEQETTMETKSQLSQELLFAIMRKPEIGMFETFQQDVHKCFLSEKDASKDIALEFYCGDAAGRPTDFSDSDFQFAKALKTQFLTPEKFITEYTDKKSG
ncbi:hypothetical protein ACO0RG_001302 [Hanseniaspora osmophila]|uniref:Polynucleotide 3'-phosphatase n=1 Tax=Hanseniaspora osmophila TaxID=56408 RepID=A0A1E5RP34_9ASCO|nr:Polynucleotide 3'-phosphatase [Hanseniaspora osmophila]